VSRTSRKPGIVTPSVKEDRKVTAAAKEDPDAQPLTAKQLKTMVPIHSTPIQKRMTKEP
jgi:hypothetical protein